MLAPDGYYYLTGTTPLPNNPRRIDDKHNTGLGAGSKSLGDNACTINEQGITIVPLDVKVLGDGQILIQA